MNNNKKVHVVEWCDSPLPIVARPRAPHRLGSPTVIGLLGTLLIHALAVKWAYGISATPSASTGDQESGAPLKSSANSVPDLVLITLPSISTARETLSRDISSHVTLTKMAVPSLADLEPAALLDNEILQLDDVQPSQSAGDAVSAAEQPRLFDIYSGQIRARVERIWRRPRTPVEQLPARADGNSRGKPFKCQVQVVQDATGNIQEVRLARCNGSAAWRRSLVIAVQQSPTIIAVAGATRSKRF